MAAASEAMTVLVHDALSVFESALAATGRATAKTGAAPGEAPSDAVPSDAVWADVTVLDPGEEPESAGPAGGPPHEPDDRG